MAQADPALHIWLPIGGLLTALPLLLCWLDGRRRSRLVMMPA